MIGEAKILLCQPPRDLISVSSRCLSPSCIIGTASNAQNDLDTEASLYGFNIRRHKGRVLF